jgi:hypothetical protein
MPHNPSAMTPWGQVIPLHRGVAPIPGEQIARIMGDEEQATTIEKIYRERGKYFSDEQAEIERRQRNLERFEHRHAILADEHLSIVRWQRVVRSFCLAVAVGATVYFALQLLRGVL